MPKEQRKNYIETSNTKLKSVRVEKAILDRIGPEYNFSKVVNKALRRMLEMEDGA